MVAFGVNDSDQSQSGEDGARPQRRRLHSSRLKVGLVDDNESVLRAWKQLLQPSYKIVGAFSEPAAALEELPQLKPQVILMDIRMPGINGIECTHRLTQSLPATRIIMVTALGDLIPMLDSFAAGASGYLLKDCSATDLIPKAIWCATQEVGVFLPVEMMTKVTRARVAQERLDPEARGLGPRETEVVELIARGCDDKTIADKLKVSINTIKSTKRALFEKLGVHSRSEAILKWIRRVPPHESGYALWLKGCSLSRRVASPRLRASPPPSNP